MLIVIYFPAIGGPAAGGNVFNLVFEVLAGFNFSQLQTTIFKIQIGEPDP